MTPWNIEASQLHIGTSNRLFATCTDQIYLSDPSYFSATEFTFHSSYHRACPLVTITPSSQVTLGTNIIASNLNNICEFLACKLPYASGNIKTNLLASWLNFDFQLNLTVFFGDSLRCSWLHCIFKDSSYQVCYKKKKHITDIWICTQTSLFTLSYWEIWSSN